MHYTARGSERARGGLGNKCGKFDRCLAGAFGPEARLLHSEYMNPPPVELLPSGLPRFQPRFAESFRTLIDHPDVDHRLMTGEWEPAIGFNRHVVDDCPRLQMAGRVSFIASTVPPEWHGRIEDYYGQDYPLSASLYWHWKSGAWVLHGGSIEEFAKRRGVPAALVSWPAYVDVPRHLQTCGGG